MGKVGSLGSTNLGKVALIEVCCLFTQLPKKYSALINQTCSAYSLAYSDMLGGNINLLFPYRIHNGNK